MDVLVCVCSLWIFLLPHFKQVVRPLSFLCLREFLQDSINKNCSKSMIPAVFCKHLWQINLCLQEEGDGREVEGSKLTPRLRCGLWPASYTSDVGSTPNPRPSQGRCTDFKGMALWGLLEICLSARFWEQGIILGAVREKESQ